MQKFFQIVPPDTYEYARFSRRGTWNPKISPGACDECGMTQQRRVPPLVIEWERDSDVVGDFAWGGFASEIVARRSIADELARHFTGFVAERIEMVGADTSHDRGKGTKPRASLAYDGPALCELWVDSWMPLDEVASQVVHEKTCGTCGFHFYKPKRSGLVLAQDPGMPDFFRLEQFPSWLFCMEGVRNFVSNRGWSNISFRDVNAEQLDWLVAPNRGPAAFADEAAGIMENAARSRGLNPNAGVRAMAAPIREVVVTGRIIVVLLAELRLQGFDLLFGGLAELLRILEKLKPIGPSDRG